MRKLRLNHNIYGAFFVLVIMGLTAVTYFTTSINQQTHTVQSQAAGTCGGNCDNKSLWISDCLRYNGSDKSSQCNDWFNAECSGCGGGNDDNNDNNDTGNNNNGGEPFDPTATANDASIQNLCGANPNDSRCCKINEWKNANQGTNLKDCSGGTGGTGGNNTAPTSVPAPTGGIGGTGSCNNGQIPNGSWACFSTTKVVQCVNGQYKNESSCTTCRGISTSKSSICSGGTAVPGQCDSPEIWCATLNKCTGRTSCPTPTPVPGQCASPEVWCAALNKCTGRTACPTSPPNTTDGRCTYIGDVDCITLTPAPGQCASPEIWCATLNKCTGRTACPTSPPNTTDGRCTYIGDVDCITLTPAPGQCASPEIWCATLNKCTGRTSCPTPTPACPGGTIRCSWSNTCMSKAECDDVNNQKPTPTVVQTANPNSCGRPDAACCSTVFGSAACSTAGYECIAGKCRVGYVGFIDDTSITQVQTKLLECTTGTSGVSCSKPEVIIVEQELIFNGCMALPSNQGFMCAE